MATNNPPLDEMQWRSPTLVQQFQGLNTNNILHYFRWSPFFEMASNNSTLFMQAQVNPALNYLFFSRDAFEARLRGMVGLEFVVAEEDPANAFWLIKKQMRRSPTVSEVQAAYFVIGENIYMAPSVHAIIESRVLSIASSLSKAHKLAESLIHFSPATGYSYSPPQPSSSSTSTASTSQISSGFSSSMLGSSLTASQQQSPMPPSSTTGTIPPSSIDKQLREESQNMYVSLQSSLRFAGGNFGYLEDTIITDPQQLMVSSGGTSATSSQQQMSQQSKKDALSGASMLNSQSQGGTGPKKTSAAVPPTQPIPPLKKRRKSKVGAAFVKE